MGAPRWSAAKIRTQAWGPRCSLRKALRWRVCPTEPPGSPLGPPGRRPGFQHYLPIPPTHTHTHSHTHTLTHMHSPTLTHSHTRTHTGTHRHSHTHTHTGTHTHALTHSHTLTCTHTHVMHSVRSSLASVFSALKWETGDSAFNSPVPSWPGALQS